MLNIRDAEDSYLAAKAKFEAWQQEFENNWYQPLGERLIKTAQMAAFTNQEVTDATDTIQGNETQDSIIRGQPTPGELYATANNSDLAGKPPGASGQ